MKITKMGGRSGRRQKKSPARLLRIFVEETVKGGEKMSREI